MMDYFVRFISYIKSFVNNKIEISKNDENTILYKIDYDYPDYVSNQKKFEHWALKRFINHYNGTIDIDKLRYFSHILENLIKKYGNYYVTNSGSYNSAMYTWLYVYGVALEELLC